MGHKKQDDPRLNCLQMLDVEEIVSQGGVVNNLYNIQNYTKLNSLNQKFQQKISPFDSFQTN